MWSCELDIDAIMLLNSEPCTIVLVIVKFVLLLSSSYFQVLKIIVLFFRGVEVDRYG